MTQMRFYRDRLTDEDVLAVFSPPEVELTRAQVAGLVKYAKGKTVNDALTRLCERGLLVVSEETLINRAVVFVYRRARNAE